MGKLLVVMLKYVTPLFILFVEISGVMGKIATEGEKYWWVIVFAVGIVLLTILAYTVFLRNKDCGTNADELEFCENQA